MNIKRYIVALPLLLAGAALHAQTPDVIERPGVTVSRMETNSTDDDFAPAAPLGGRVLMFTSARSGGKQKLMFSTRTGDGWSAPEAAGDALEEGGEVGTATLTPDGNYMVFAAFEWDAEGADTGQGRTDLYSAERVDGQWSNVQNLGPAVNSSSWDSQPALTSDGRTLYFASDRPGGLGGSDIYVTTRTESGWEAPTALGGGLNTAEDDCAPSIAPDGKSLFFSSKGHGGVGGFDIFVAMGGSQRGLDWSSLENLGTPINSSADDYFFVSIPNSDSAFFSSNRAGDHDVFSALPNPFAPDALITVSGRIVSADTKLPIAATISITDLTSGEVVAKYRVDGSTGEYFVVLTKGRRYSVTAEAPDHIFYSDEYSVPQNTVRQNLRKDIELQPTSGGSTRLLVFFDVGKTALKPASLPDLGRTVEFLRENPNLTVEIAGYSDSVGVASSNIKLSLNRAESVRKHLISTGIDAPRLVARGYGEESPVASNSTEEGRAQNRRVEMRVIPRAD